MRASQRPVEDLAMALFCAGAHRHIIESKRNPFASFMSIVATEPPCVQVQASGWGDPASAGVLATALLEHFGLPPVSFSWASIPNPPTPGHSSDAGAVFCEAGREPEHTGTNVWIREKEIESEARHQTAFPGAAL